MEEYWFLLSILVTLSIGIVAFINKVFAQRKYNVQLSLLILYFVMLCISVWVVAFQWFIPFTQIWNKNILWASLWWLQFYGYSFVMLNALKYLPTSTYFISVRLSSSFVLLFTGIIFFWDIISWKEVVWFILWIIAMLLLFEKNSSQKLYLQKWLFFLWLGIICLVFWHTITKVLSTDLYQVPTLLAIAFSSAFFVSFIFGYKHIRKNSHQIQWIFWINLLQSFFFFIYFYYLFQVYNIWDLGISYKIQSYSPFIPIILATLIYREKISKKQRLGILITAISLYFFA